MLWKTSTKCSSFDSLPVNIAETTVSIFRYSSGVLYSLDYYSKDSCCHQAQTCLKRSLIFLQKTWKWSSDGTFIDSTDLARPSWKLQMQLPLFFENPNLRYHILITGQKGCSHFHMVPERSMWTSRTVVEFCRSNLFNLGMSDSLQSTYFLYQTWSW